MKKYSCSKPNHQSSERISTHALLVFEGCADLSGDNTSHITRLSEFLGPVYSFTGLIMQSELEPSACCVDEPSKDQSGGLPSVTLTLLLKLGSG